MTFDIFEFMYFTIASISMSLFIPILIVLLLMVPKK